MNKLQKQCENCKTPETLVFPEASSPPPSQSLMDMWALVTQIFSESFQKPGKFNLALGEMKYTKMKPIWSLPSRELKQAWIGGGRASKQ